MWTNRPCHVLLTNSLLYDLELALAFFVVIKISLCDEPAMDKRFRLIKFKWLKTVNFQHNENKRIYCCCWLPVVLATWYKFGWAVQSCACKKENFILGIAFPHHFVLVFISMLEIIWCYLSHSYSIASIHTHECSIDWALKEFSTAKVNQFDF